ncbi:MAG: PP2C family protein-serine/threonine phosphatase [Nocardioidaceae bacterium]
MVAAPHPDRLTRGRVPRRVARRWQRGVRRMREAEAPVVLFLLTLAIGIALLAVRFGEWVPLTTLVVPMLVASLVLGPRSLPWFVVASLIVLAGVVAATPGSLDALRIMTIVVIFLIGLVILVSSFRRSRLGVGGARGESMLVDLRDRLSKQSTLPELPGGWYGEALMRSAGGASFAGDFIVASKTSDDHLEVAVVDVSGKGEQAGTRSLLLSGAFGGLLGALPAGRFLPAANDYLLRQDWAEGFATAIHLSLDLDTGEFELRSAGHPPGVQLHAGSGRWGVHASEGPVLGLVPDAEFISVSGHIHRGDAILLYTDGLVETPQRDISLGIDKLVGQGEQLLRAGFERGARRLIDRLESENDDRALLLIHRR